MAFADVSDEFESPVGSVEFPQNEYSFLIGKDFTDIHLLLKLRDGKGRVVFAGGGVFAIEMMRCEIVSVESRNGRVQIPDGQDFVIASVNAFFKKAVNDAVL